MGSAVQANKAVEWMKAYRELHKTPAQVHEALRKRRIMNPGLLSPKKGILKRPGGQSRAVGFGAEGVEALRFSDDVFNDNEKEQVIDPLQDPQLLIQDDPRGPLLPSPPLTSSPYLPSSLSPVADKRKNLARILPSRPLSSPRFSPNGCRPPSTIYKA
mmetsp:Transcript_50826/g.90392  ORF Transcript_50826/g.90392 Transcript_50826/m.90392 type:complete len:158 (+) Transcript_50826:1-474(+)